MDNKLSDLQNKFLFKYTTLKFAFVYDDEIYNLYELNKKLIYKDFNFIFACDFLFNYFLNLFYLIEFSTDDNIYFCMHYKFNKLNFKNSYDFNFTNIYNCINNKAKKLGYDIICV